MKESSGSHPLLVFHLRDASCPVGDLRSFVQPPVVKSRGREGFGALRVARTMGHESLGLKVFPVWSTSKIAQWCFSF